MTRVSKSFKHVFCETKKSNAVIVSGFLQHVSLRTNGSHDFWETTEYLKVRKLKRNQVIEK